MGHCGLRMHGVTGRTEVPECGRIPRWNSLEQGSCLQSANLWVGCQFVVAINSEQGPGPASTLKAGGQQAPAPQGDNHCPQGGPLLVQTINVCSVWRLEMGSHAWDRRARSQGGWVRSVDRDQGDRSDWMIFPEGALRSGGWRWGGLHFHSHPLKLRGKPTRNKSHLDQFRTAYLAWPPSQGGPNLLRTNRALPRLSARTSHQDQVYQSLRTAKPSRIGL